MRLRMATPQPALWERTNAWKKKVRRARLRRDVTAPN